MIITGHHGSRGLAIMRSLYRCGTLSACALALLFQVTPQSALAADAIDQRISIDIPKDTSLEDALIEWGTKAGMTVMMNTPMVSHTVTQGIKGTLSARAALSALLRGSGLSYTEEGNRIRVVQARTLVHSSLRDTSGPETPSKDSGASERDESSDSTVTHNGRRDELSVVVVTANKRKEDVMDVPSSVSVLSEQQLEDTQPQSLIDLNGLVPGLTITSGGTPGQVHLTLRGISVANTGTPLVGTYIDEVPWSSSDVVTMDLMPYDVERIEVLSGPQGTLYGASAMGGQLKYVLKEPQLRDFESRAGVNANYTDGGDRPGGGFHASVNIPLVTDVFGLRLSGYHQKNQGYINNVGPGSPQGAHDYNPSTEDGGRIAALWKVNDQLKIKLAAVLQTINAGGTASVLVDPLTLNPTFGELTTANYAPTSFIEHSRLYYLVVDWDLEFATLTSASSWQTQRNLVNQDLTYGTAQWRGLVALTTGGLYTDASVAFPNTQSTDTSTEEIRLTSRATDRFEWMLGGFYTRQNIQGWQPVYALEPNGQETPGVNPFFANNGFPGIYEEVAAFTNDTYHFSDRFALSAGARYAINHQSVTNSQYGAIFLPTCQNPFCSSIYTSSRQGVATWMVSPEWHFNKDSMVYARVATGYRPGGATGVPAGSTAPASYNADTLTNYELGVKSSALDKRLDFTFALYDIEWKDIQVLVLQPGTGLQYLGNGKTARSRGGELGLSYVATDGLHLGATLGYVNAHLTADAPGVGGLNGATLPLSSKVNGAVAADYRWAIKTDAAFQAGASFRYATDVWNFVSSNAAAVDSRQPRLLDLYTGIQYGRLDARLYLRNALSSQPRIVALQQPSSYAAFEALSFTPIQPRTVGVNFDVSF